jgi:MOSC domain-containing protein YiiM
MPHGVSLQANITGIYAGRARALTADGALSAIFKEAVDAPVRIGPEGIHGDQQADRSVHGGPEKAVHQFAAGNYAALAGAYPQVAAALVPGSIGENLSSADIDQDSVCIGDIFTLGSATLQVCQPRSPCWKIDARYGVPGMSRFVSENCLAGWYYRVLQDGDARSGDTLRLIARNADPVTLREFWSAWLSRSPAVAQLQRLRGTPGLASGWIAYLNARLEKIGDRTEPAISSWHPRKDI